MVEVFLDQIVYWGESGASLFLAKKLEEFGAKRILLVTGKSSYISSGAESFVNEALKGHMIFRFHEFDPNPTLDDLRKGLEVFSKYKPDCVIAIGGGSVLDMAKLINLFGSTESNPSKYLDGQVAIGQNPLLPMIVSPTTAGTGSEATHFSVLYREAVKYSVAERVMLPSIVILNPFLTVSMTAYQTACTGVDALAQGIESYWAVGATSQSQKYAVRAIKLSLQYLEQAVLNPDEASRKGMQEAAYWSGRAINISKTTLCHALSYSLTSHYGLPHGHAVGLTLPAVFLANSGVLKDDVNHPQGVEYVRKKISSLCALLGVDSPEAGAQLLQLMFNRIGISSSWISDHGFSPLQARSFVVQEVNTERLLNNPCKIGQELLSKIVLDIR